MSNTKISAEVVADSKDTRGNRLTSLLVTFPRIILAEVNTHRMLSKNTSSSRAIPFKKMVQAVIDNPFIPIAFQKDHSGMQGTEYLDPTETYTFPKFAEVLKNIFKYSSSDIDTEITQGNKIIELLDSLYSTSVYDYENKTLIDWWLYCRDQAVKTAMLMAILGVTKQLCNRLLEPFMWTTMLITGSKEGWDNFFNLRCPQYVSPVDIHFKHKSKKDVIAAHSNPINLEKFENFTDLDWLQINKGQAEIHMMELAERIYDAVNESTPRQLKAGGWHIPFENKISSNVLDWSDDIKVQAELLGRDLTMHKVKVSTAMSARTSYTVVADEKEISYSRMIELHDRLIAQDPPHSSPLEHVSQAMEDKEYYLFSKGKDGAVDHQHGWCGPYKGFKSYRYIIDNQIV